MKFEQMDGAEAPALRHPLLDDPLAFAILRSIEDASSTSEWNAQVGQLVRFLLSASAPAETRRDPRFGVWAGRLSFTISQGHSLKAGKKKQGRPGSVIDARSDAMLIRDLFPCTTMAEATEVLANWHGVSKDAARKMAMRACKADGLKLARARPFGRK